MHEYKPIEIQIANGGVLVVDEDHADVLRTAGEIIVIKRRPHVAGFDGKLRTVLSVLGLRGWKPKDDNWFDLRTDRLVKPHGPGGASTGRGYYFDTENRKWRAKAFQNGKQVSLGSFDTEQEAKEAREAFLRNNITS